MSNQTQQKGNTQAQARPRSFLVGTQPVIEGNDHDETYTVTNATNGRPWALTATGWLRGLWLLFKLTGLTAGTATADAPFNILANIELDDVNNEAIFGPFDGYTAFLSNKYGGYYYADDPSTSAEYSVSGTTSTNNGTFVLYIPLEIVNRDPIGAVASVNNTAALTLKYSMNPTATVFSTPTGTLQLNVKGTQDFYWQPKLADAQGRNIQKEPPASGTTQYWTQGSQAIAGTGVINVPLTTGLGYPWREYIFLLRDATGSRANGETNWPDPIIGIKFEANMIVSNYSKTLWQHMMSATYGYKGAPESRGAGVAVGKENGVYVLNFNKDFYLNHPGGESRRGYLSTSPGSNFIFNGAVGGAGNLYCIVNYVAPGGGQGSRNNTAILTGGQ